MSKEKDKISEIKKLIEDNITLLEEEYRQSVTVAKVGETMYADITLGKLEILQQIYNEIQLIKNQ
jgi:hypothetical protein